MEDLARILSAFLGSALGTGFGLWWIYRDRRKWESMMMEAHVKMAAATEAKIARIEAHVGLELSARFFQEA